MTDTRTLVLGVAAAGLVAVLAIRTLGGAGDVGDKNGSSDGESSVADVTTPLTVGAPTDLDLEQLQARYQTIGEADPFARRDFRPKRAPRPTRRDPGTKREVPVAAPPPNRIELRLTGLTGIGAERRALFESRSDRKALLAADGWEFEDVSIAAVQTLSVQAVDQGKTRTLQLGDTLAVLKAVRDQLVDIKASSSPSATSYQSTTSTAPAEPLSDDKRQSILERLRAKRNASLKKPPSGD